MLEVLPCTAAMWRLRLWLRAKAPSQKRHSYGRCTLGEAAPCWLLGAELGEARSPRSVEAGAAVRFWSQNAKKIDEVISSGKR